MCVIGAGRRARRGETMSRDPEGLLSGPEDRIAVLRLPTGAPLPADPVVLRVDLAEVERDPHQIDDDLIRPAARDRLGELRRRVADDDDLRLSMTSSIDSHRCRDRCGICSLMYCLLAPTSRASDTFRS